MQKSIAICFAEEVLKSISEDIGDDEFALLVDESCEVSVWKKIAVILRYVDPRGFVKERFVGFARIKEASVSELECAIYVLFAKLKLSLKQVRGQGYDVACNLHGEFNGLKALILSNKLLSRALQRKSQYILEAVSLVEGTKRQLQRFRQTGFDLLLKEIYSFCEAHDVEKLDMAEGYVNTRNRMQRTNITNRHYYEYDIFNNVVDLQIQEFGDRFSTVNTGLLKNMAALSPHDSFSQFNASNLLKLCEFYPDDFNQMERMTLEHELASYYDDVHQDDTFANLNGIVDLARLMVETSKHLSYPLVYRLLKLALVLPVEYN